MLFRDIDTKIAVIGLGYVGLPLAVELAKKFQVYGFDINKQRIKNIKQNYDETGELEKKKLKKTSAIISSDEKILLNANVFIVTVPTGINKKNLPDLRILKKSSTLLSKYIKKKTLIIYESTVYPGCTEEICIPILKKNKKFKYNKDFFVGYSPERISPGDKKRNVTNITKIVSASNKKALKQIKHIYSKIVKSGIYVAPSIKIAEAAKAIENTQRDLNIGLMNELFVFFNKIKIPTKEVLKAASTKWNFLNFHPGLVGGHCIGVDPYYLTNKYKAVNLIPSIILSGRKTNNDFHKFIARKVDEIIKDNNLSKKKILVMGYSFKENCPDYRNTRVYHLIMDLQKKKIKLKIHDPYLQENKDNFPFKNLSIESFEQHQNKYDLIILTVPHKIYLKKQNKILNLLTNKGLIYDFKSKLKNNKRIIQF